MKRVVVLPEADAKLAAAFSIYRAIDMGLGSRFQTFVQTALIYRRLPTGQCSLRLVFKAMQNPPLSIFLLYVVLERNGDQEIVVVSCVHMRSDPESWYAI